mgnify:CR=1 FL=1
MTWVELNWISIKKYVSNIGSLFSSSESRSFTQDGSIERVFCPFSGNFRFTYDINEGPEDIKECAQATSTIQNCPRASELEIKWAYYITWTCTENIWRFSSVCSLFFLNKSTNENPFSTFRFQRCSFADMDVKMQCLGNWRGYDGQMYMALHRKTNVDDGLPRYRCAVSNKYFNSNFVSSSIISLYIVTFKNLKYVYQYSWTSSFQMYNIDPINGDVNVSFSIDATCRNKVLSPWEGHEMMNLAPSNVIRPPTEVKSHACTFPDWARDVWQNLQVGCLNISLGLFMELMMALMLQILRHPNRYIIH